MTDLTGRSLEMTENWIWILAIAMALVTGYLFGRTSSLAEEIGGEEPPIRKGILDKEWEKKHGFQVVDSPVAGTVVAEEEDDTVITIRPRDNKLFAPTAGKVLKIFPMGNQFLFETEFGAELTIQVGDTSDDMLGVMYRPRVVNHEIVPEGKLLLEFDREGLEEQGVEPTVKLKVLLEEGQAKELFVEDGVKLSRGEELFCIYENAAK